MAGLRALGDGPAGIGSGPNLFGNVRLGCDRSLYVLPANADPSRALTVFNSAAADHGLRVAIWWWVPGMLLVLGYFVLLYRSFAGKVHAEGAAEGGRSEVSPPGALL